jgi:Tol biopolymer transport system component
MNKYSQMMRNIKIPFSPRLVVLVFLLVLSVQSSYSQFGQNKVQYKVFDWKYLRTKHFDIYFSQEGDYVAQFTAFAAESALVKLTDNIGYRIQNRIPIIVFNSHNDFQQNNALDEYLPEGVGGVTELFKNRVLVPFEGDYDKFRHVIHHELLHAYMNDFYYGGSIQNIISQNIRLQFPIWFNEGMAEYQSLDGNDKANDEFIRDAVIYDYLPDLNYVDGYLAYRGGQSFFSWLADEYGKEKIGDLMQSIKGLGDVEAGFEDVYKMPLNDLSDKWHKALKQEYWPDIKSRQELNDFAVRLTDSRKGDGYYNTAPTISPKGNKIAYISNRDDYFAVYIADVKTKKVITKLIEGNSTADFEELHLLAPGLCWSPDEKYIAIAVKSGNRDAIHLINVETEEEEAVLPTKFYGVFSTSWNPVNNSLVFVGDNAKQSDIWIYDIKKKQMKQVTNDPFSDYEPSWSKDGRKIYFTSDRGDFTDPKTIPPDFKMSNYDYKQKAIYVYDVGTEKLEKFQQVKNANERSMQFSEDGKKALYLSDRNGINNIWLRDMETGEERPITNSIDPINFMSLSHDGKRLAFNALSKGGYDLFYIENPFEIDLKMKELPNTIFVENQNRDKVKHDSMSTAFLDSLKTDTTLLGMDFRQADSLSKEITKSKIDSAVNFYGNNIQLNLNQTKTDTESVKYLTHNVKLKDKEDKKFMVANNMNDDGSFKINKYKIKFSPDLIYTNASYSSFYGVQGIVQMSFSDVMGNHRIYAATSLVLDLKNSDYAFAYFYLPKRIDYGISAYHSARFLLIANGPIDQLYRYRQYGGNFSMSFPISKFNRLEGGLNFTRLTKENLDDPTEPMEQLNYFMPVVSYVHDNTLFGYTAPVRGTRYNLTMLGSPNLGKHGAAFFTGMVDYRTYFKFWGDYGFVWRLNAGGSVGPDPQRFYLGGTENWINYTVRGNHLPIEDIKDFAFSTPIMPLRGYAIDERSGSKFMLMNAEFRFPLFRYLVLGALPLAFQNIMGVAFLDAGTVWNNNKSLRLFENQPDGLHSRDLLVGMGLGARVFLLYFPFKFDVAWRYDMKYFTQPMYYISMGADF